MYKYDAIDQTLVDQRVAQFRDQVSRRLKELQTLDLIELTGKEVKSNSGRAEREWRFKPVQQELL